MSKKIVNLMLLLAGVLSVSCGSQQREKNAQQKVEPQHLVGNAKDSHGCLTSAGYQWSALLNDCIRPFEKGVRLDPTADNPTTGMTCLVFNADSSKVEVFMPQMEQRPILERQMPSESWTSTAEPTIVVKKEGKEWNAYVDGELKFQSK